MTPKELLLEMLDQLAREHWCGTLHVTFHGEVPTEVDRTEAQKFVAPRFEPRGPEGQPLERRSAPA